MSKFKIRYRYGGGPAFLRDDSGKEVFATVEEADAVVMAHKKLLTAPKDPPLLWLPPSVQIVEILSPKTIQRYRITPEGPLVVKVEIQK